MRVITEEELKNVIQKQGLGAYQPTGPFQEDILLAMRNLAAALFGLGYRETVVDNIPENLQGIFFQE
ncbi:MAG: hypothetical protein WC726_02450 [Parcubacteria group bacterium]|jgi:hypothetical protein